MIAQSQSHIPNVTSPRQKAIREVHFKNKYKSGSQEDFDKDAGTPNTTGHYRPYHKAMPFKDKESWIKTQNLQSLIDINNTNENISEKRVNLPPRLIPKSTQNKMNKITDRMSGSNDIEVNFGNKVALTQHDVAGNMPSPTYVDQD